MKFTGSVTGSGTVNFPVAGIVAINAMGGGQSLIDRMGWDAFIASSPSGSQYAEGAVGGTPTTKTVGDQTLDPYWVDDSAAPSYTAGALLTSYLSIVDGQYSSRSDVNVVIWQQWNTSRNYVRLAGGAGFLTKAEYKAAVSWLFDEFRSEHGADTVIVVGLPHRRTSGTAQEDEGCQLMREAYIELAEADALIYMVEHCDIDLDDATHHSIPAGEDEFGERMAAMANYAINGTAKPDYPVMLSASIDYNEITLTFDSDITAPSSGVGQCAGEQNNAEKVGTTLTRTGDSTALFTLDTNVGIRTDDSPYMRIGSGQNTGLASTSADTLNNSAGTLPARGAKVAITDANPIHGISSIHGAFYAKWSTKTYGTGAEITAIEGLYGEGLEEHPNATNTPAHYDATMCNGNGAMKCNASSDCMQNVDSFTADSDKTLFLVLDLPATATGTRICTFGLFDGAGNTGASLYTTGTGLRYAKDEGGGFPTLIATTGGGTHVLCLRWNSNSSMDYFWDEEAVTGNIDPSDVFNIYSHIHYFARPGNTDGATGAGIGARVIFDGALSNTDVATVMNELGSRYGVTIS